MKLFSVLLNCFTSAHRYEEINHIELPQHIEGGGGEGGGGGGGEESTEDFEQGVHINVQRLAGGSRQVKRIKFSCQVFSEMQAKLWWKENRVRVREHYATVGK
ncbi:hypothetical protein SUGI_0179760 [Cryptomeria japonica]|nr:hypothetical protein SUGI_0179760 [Cryptomeria japonica]